MTEEAGARQWDEEVFRASLAGKHKHTHVNAQGKLLLERTQTKLLWSQMLVVILGLIYKHTYFSDLI